AADHWLARGTSSCGLIVASGRTHPASLWTEADAESRAATHAAGDPPRMPGLPGLLWGVRPLLHHGIQGHRNAQPALQRLAAHDSTDRMDRGAGNGGRADPRHSSMETTRSLAVEPHLGNLDRRSMPWSHLFHVHLE